MIPVLSVCMISYNHEAFIEEAIKSILEQKTSFPFELVISDDASLDKTNEKILNATKDLPKHVTLKYFDHKSNLGMYANFEFALNACHSSYIAICEGDDYWIDSRKLQKQVDFLENNPDFNLVTGYVNQYIESSKKFVKPQALKSFTFNYKDMIIKNHCSTCTTTFKNFMINEGPLKLMPNLGCDFQLWMRVLGKNGKAMKMDEVLAVYRRHENSSTSVRNKKLSSFAFFRKMVNDKLSNAEAWNQYFDNDANYSILKLKSIMYKKIAKVAYSRNKFGYFILYIFYHLKFYLLLKLSISE